jgi:hypothetical protein
MAETEGHMHPLFWFAWLNETMAFGLRRPRRRPVLRVIEGGRKTSAPPLIRYSRMSVIRQVR